MLKRYYNKVFKCEQANYTIDFWGKDKQAANHSADMKSQLQLLQDAYPGINVFFLNQQHETSLVGLPEKSMDEIFWADADAAYTDRENQAVVIRVADCIPILFWDTERILAGGIHAGWRGLDKNIIVKTINKIALSAQEKENLFFWVGPHIQPRSYEVGPEVAAKFPPDCSLPSKNSGKFMLNLNHILHHQFQEAEIREEQVIWQRDDTLTSDFLFSHRGQDEARNAAVIHIQFHHDGL